MSKKRLTYLLSCVVGIGLAASACGTPAEDPVDAAAVEAELVAAMADFRAAALAGDMDRFFGLLTPDVRFAEPGVSLAGDELREFLRGMFESAEVESFEVRPFDHFVHGDVAYELGEYDEVIRMDGDARTIEGHYFLRWERGDDGVWRVDRLVAGPREAPGGM